MTHYTFTTLLQFKKRKKYQLLTVIFNYYLPEQFEVWQHPEYGSIHLVEVLDAFTNKPLPSLDIDYLIMLRRSCWNYLEHHQLFLKHNIQPLFV
ncbi:TPA: hypothetical protein ACM2VO_003200 [Legionella pneumophila]